MAGALTFEALASRSYVLSSAENFVLYVLFEAIAQGRAAPEPWRARRSTWALSSIGRARCTTSGGSSS